MIVSGLGIGILPVMTVSGENPSGKLWPLRLVDQPLGADVFLVNSPVSEPTAPEQKFIDLIDELLKLYPDMI